MYMHENSTMKTMIHIFLIYSESEKKTKKNKKKKKQKKNLFRFYVFYNLTENRHITKTCLYNFDPLKTGV